jgi:RNA polymerase sigma factor (sigma-70 family)
LEALPEILCRCKANDRRAQKLLYDRYYPYCMKIVFRYIFHYDKAVDVVNDGFVKVFTKLDKFHCEQPQSMEPILLGWIKTIMINTAIDRLRKDNYLPEIGHIDDSFWMEDRSQTSDQTVLYKELVMEIKKLPPSYRAVFNLYVIDGYTHQEISDQLHIAVGTSKSNLSKARVLLQKYIQQNEQQRGVCYM